LSTSINKKQTQQPTKYINCTLLLLLIIIHFCTIGGVASIDVPENEVLGFFNFHGLLLDSSQLEGHGTLVLLGSVDPVSSFCAGIAKVVWNRTLNTLLIKVNNLRSSFNPIRSSRKKLADRLDDEAVKSLKYG
jgi:hypothetical protein